MLELRVGRGGGVPQLQNTFSGTWRTPFHHLHFLDVGTGPREVKWAPEALAG